MTAMRFAYADPPYLGVAAKHYGRLHEQAADFDKPETHGELVTRLCDEYPDGWALSLSSVSLRTILPMCPPDVRVMAWVKAWASWKPNVSPAYAWEPVIIRGGRKGRRKVERAMGMTTVVDWIRTVARQEGFTGAKPDEFVWWLLAALNVYPEDEVVDLFPGSGAVGRAWEAWRSQLRLPA